MENAEPVLVYDRIDANRRNTLLLLGLFALISLPAAAYVAQYLAFVIAVFAFAGGEWEVNFIAGAVIAVGIVLAAAYIEYRYASALVLRLAGARPLERDQEPQLRRTVENLCIGAGLPQPLLYVVESPAANAFSTGLSPQRASLVVTRGLLTLLDRRDLEGVLAHELVQIGNHDTRLSTVLAAGVGLLRLPLAIVVATVRFLFRIHWALGWGLLLYLGLPLLASVPFAIAVAGDFLDEDILVGVIFISSMLIPFYVFLAAPLLAYIIRRLVLRRREFLADAEAVLLTRYAEGLATALTKMGAAGGSPMSVGGATAHLYVVDPLPADAPLWDRLFPTHPPIERRTALLAQMGGGIAPSVLRAAEEAGARFAAAASAIADPPRWERAPAAAEAGGPAGEPERETVAFRLTGGGATLHAGPDASSPPLAQLADGALITVVEEDGDFLRVLTADDEFGYLPRSTPMSEFDLDGPAAT